MANTNIVSGFSEAPVPKIKQTTTLRTLSNKIKDREYQVYLLPIPIAIARSLKLPKGLVMSIEYDPEQKNTLKVGWENGIQNGTPENDSGTERQNPEALGGNVPENSDVQVPAPSKICS